MMMTLIIEVCYVDEDRDNNKAQKISLVTTVILSLTKILFIRLKSKNMFKIINNAVNDWQSVLNYERKKIMKKFAKKARKILIYQMAFSFMTVNMMILDSLPVSHDNLNLTADSQLLNSFPMKTTYYFGYTELSWYKYTALYFLQIIQLIFCVIGNVGNDCYFFGMAMHLSGQFVTLQLQTKDFETEIKKSYNCTNYIKNFVKKHQQLMDTANCLKESFNFILIVQLANNAFSVLLMGIQMILNIRSELKSGLSNMPVSKDGELLTPHLKLTNTMNIKKAKIDYKKINRSVKRRRTENERQYNEKCLSTDNEENDPKDFTDESADDDDVIEFQANKKKKHSKITNINNKKVKDFTSNDDDDIDQQKKTKIKNKEVKATFEQDVDESHDGTFNVVHNYNQEKDDEPEHYVEKEPNNSMMSMFGIDDIYG
ncbi:hypothetical protein HCN44_009950 [Aphidius gifuensis]|uniref:Odorant receptor n=1 Tax=Aphidius gifuensis TaxID=684658 RepID=A0A834Y329_APHGI|nr:hypothetical protein HCN44_009950 [Aphidius gifuensis]